MNELFIIRADTSPYQKRNFQHKEQLALESVKASNFRLSYQKGRDKKKSYPQLSHPTVLLTNTHTDLSQISNLKYLELIIHANSGYDNFEVPFVKKAGFPIITGNSIRAQAVANYILSCLFDHLSRITHQHKWVPKRQWDRSLLNEKNVLLIGQGHIGTIIKNSLLPLVNKISIFDPYRPHANSAGKTGTCPVCQLDNLNDIKKLNAHIIIPCAGLNPGSHHIINESVLLQLPDDFLLINAARGGLVDQKALKKILRRRRKAFCYLDVFEKEPYPLNEFKNCHNIVTTSHIAGVFGNIDRKIIDFEVKVLEDFLYYKSQGEIIKFKKIYKNLSLKNKIKSNILI